MTNRNDPLCSRHTTLCKSNKETKKTRSNLCCGKFFSARSAFVEQQWQFVQDRSDWFATGVISKCKLCFSFSFSALNPIRAEQQNNMDYIVTQTRVLKSEMIVFNLIWVSWGSFLTCLSVREALYDFIALYSLLSVSVSVSLACVFIPQFSPAFGGFIHPNPSGLLTRPNSLHSFHSHLDSLSLFL